MIFAHNKRKLKKETSYLGKYQSDITHEYK